MRRKSFADTEYCISGSNAKQFKQVVLSYIFWGGVYFKETHLWLILKANYS